MLELPGKAGPGDAPPVRPPPEAEREDTRTSVTVSLPPNLADVGPAEAAIARGRLGDPVPAG